MTIDPKVTPGWNEGGDISEGSPKDELDRLPFTQIGVFGVGSAGPRFVFGATNSTYKNKKHLFAVVSPNGKDNWVRKRIGSLNYGPQGMGLAFGNGKFLMTPKDYFQSGQIATSTDGDNWDIYSGFMNIDGKTLNTNHYFGAPVFFKGKFYVYICNPTDKYGFNGVISSTDAKDGSDWTYHGNPTGVWDVGYRPKFGACATDTAAMWIGNSSYKPYTLVRTKDGTTFDSVDLPGVSSPSSDFDHMDSDGKIVVIGSNNKSGSITSCMYWSDNDGDSWNPCTMPPPATGLSEVKGISSVNYGNGRWIACVAYYYSETEQILVSNDGKKWEWDSGVMPGGAKPKWGSALFGEVDGKPIWCVCPADGGPRISMWSETGSSAFYSESTRKYGLGPGRYERAIEAGLNIQYYDVKNKTTIDTKGIIGRFGDHPQNIDLNKYGIFELTEQPEYEIEKFVREGNKYKPIIDYGTVSKRLTEELERLESSQ